MGRWAWLGAVVLCALALAGASGARTTGLVLSVSGMADGAGSCSGSVCTTLRSAISLANTTPGADEIDLGKGVYQVALGATTPEDANATGDLDITDSVTIKGQGADVTSIAGALPVNKGERDLEVLGAGDVTFSGLAITGGQDGGNAPTGVGAGLLAAGTGTVTLDHVWIHGNAATGHASYGEGGGVAVTSGTLVISDSLISNNMATGPGYGAGLFVDGSATNASLTNVTVTGNNASSSAGGIEVNSPTAHLELAYVTISGNQATMAAGGLGAAIGAHVRDSIIDGNSSTSGSQNCETAALAVSDGGNVADPACGLALSSDAQTLDPQLGGLAGSPIATFVPNAGSPALDRAVGSCPADDALGTARPQGSTCDAGAAERPVASFSLAVAATGSGSGTITSSPAGIACGTTCSSKLFTGSKVTLTAIASAGSTFAGWSGGGCSGASTTCNLTLSGDTSVRATFDRVGGTTPKVEPPNTALVGSSIHPVRGDATFRFTGTKGTKRFQCALRSKTHPLAGFSACSSPARYANLRAGTYTFEVRAVGTKARDATPAKRTFRIV